MEAMKVVDLFELGVRLPKEHVRMVVAQPYLADGVLTHQEPYRVTDEAKERLSERLNRTIDVAGQERAHFTVIPEYSVPGLDGITAIEGRVASDAWPAGRILIAGIDGLDKDEYASVVENCDTYVDDVNGKRLRRAGRMGELLHHLGQVDRRKALSLGPTEAVASVARTNYAAPADVQREVNVPLSRP